MRSLPVDLSRYAELWQTNAIRWYTAYFILGGLAVMLPAIIASGLIDHIASGPLWTKLIALAASAVSGMQFFLKCDRRADRFHIAYRTLNTAKFKYEQSEDYPLSEVINAYDKGEEFIESAFAPIESQSPQSK